MSFRFLHQMLTGGVAKSTPRPVAKSTPRPFQDAALRDLRLGGQVDLSPAQATFLLASQKGSILTPPSSSLYRIIAHTSTPNGDFTVERFYMKAEDDSDYLLEIPAINGHAPDEIYLFQKVADIDPSTPEEWDAFLVGADGNPRLIGGPVLDWQGTEYRRAWGGEGGVVEPVHLVEHFTGSGKCIVSNEMLYERQVTEDLQELLWIASLFDEACGERWIEGRIGLHLRRGEFLAT